MIKKILIQMIFAAFLGGCTLLQIPQQQKPVSTSFLETQVVALVTPAPTETATSSIEIVLTPTPSNTPEPLPTSAPSSPTTTSEIRTLSSAKSQNIIIDHTSIDLFELIPDEFLAKARNLKMVYADRSVGQNINLTLDCLTASSWADSPGYCRRDYINEKWEWESFNQADYANGHVPQRILFDPDPMKYNRENWVFVPHGGDWSTVTEDFIVRIAPTFLNEYDVLSYQFNYFHVDPNSDIVDRDKGFFSDNPNKFDIKDLEIFISTHPDKIFIFWTTSLARGIGSQTALEFNDQMRAYAVANNKILFDVADILSHTAQGIPCYDNRDDIEYCSLRENCENYPDDGLQLPAICQDYTTETNGGHLGSVSSGGLRVAKGFWVLMARIAGWDGIP